MAAWCADRNVQLTVLTTGWPEIGYPWLAEAMRAEGIYFYDLRGPIVDAVRANPGAFTIKGDGHPNEEGARLIAQAAWPICKPGLVSSRAAR
jgi:hypothetical protein